MNQYIRLLFPMMISLAFIALGFYLINTSDDQWTTMIGYANIIFFSFLILYTVARILYNRKINK